MTADPNQSELVMRPLMAHNLRYVWNMSEGSLESLIKEINSNVKNRMAKDYLDTSLGLLRKIVETIIAEEDYQKHEDPEIFRELNDGLEEAFKKLFFSYLTESGLPIDDDSINRLNLQFYESQAQKRGLRVGQYVRQSYPPIVYMIKFVRNCQKHSRNMPLEHITGVRSYGNIYTISSELILAIYAYKEILECWCETGRMFSTWKRETG